MILWFLTNWKFILLGVVILLATHAAAYFKGKDDCKAAVITKTVEKVITVKEKQDVIRNNKPTVIHTADRLRRANF